ncbi:VPS37B subunit of ESCRT-I b [Aplochiton taeniatus]
MEEMAVFNDKLSSFTMAQLNELLEDDEKLNSIIKEMDEMREVQQIKDLTQASNMSLAEQNLRLQPSLDHQKNQLTKHYGHLQELYDNYQLRKSTLDYSSGNSSLDIMLALLQAEGAKIEEETEIMADSFLDGEVSLDSFMDSYHRKRRLAHLRRIKIDKLREIVLKGPLQTNSTSANLSSLPNRPHELPTSPSFQANGSPSPTPTRAPPPAPLPSQPSALPYPVIAYPALPSMSPSSYPSSPYMAQSYPSPVSQHPAPSARLPSRTGFIMQ